MGKERFPIQSDLMNHTVPIGELPVFIPQSWHTAHQVEQHRSSRHLKSIHIKHRCVATLIHPLQLSDNHHLIHTHWIAFQHDAVEIYRPTSAITLIVFIKVAIRQLQVLRVCFISHIRHLHHHSGHIVLLHTLLQHIHSMKKIPVLIRHRHRLHRRIVQAHQLDVCTWKRIRLGIHLICTVYATGYGQPKFLPHRSPTIWLPTTKDIHILCLHHNRHAEQHNNPYCLFLVHDTFATQSWWEIIFSRVIGVQS